MHRILVCLLLAPALGAAERDPLAYVDPLIGTQKSRIGYGGTMPFVSPPFAMTNWTPQTRQNKISVTSYEHGDTAISGFIGTHQPAIWMGDYGYVTVMPQVGALRTTPEARQLAFSHSDEIARPDYYSVTLRPRKGLHSRRNDSHGTMCFVRFRFPTADVARVLIEISRPNIAGFAAVARKSGEITGYNPHRMDAHLGPRTLPNFKGYFVVQFRQAPRNAGTYGLEKEDASASRGAFAEFRPGELVEVRVGTSFLSVDQARANLRHEIADWNFDAVRAKLHSAWAEKLGRLELEGATNRERTRLYTALYHALLYPRMISEYGRYYSAFDDRVHNGESYTAYSMWDTFRAENSLLTLIAPERIDDMVHCPSAGLPGRRMDAEVAESVVYEYHGGHARRLGCRGGNKQRVSRLRSRSFRRRLSSKTP